MMSGYILTDRLLVTTGEKRSFGNAVDAVLAFVAELPARRLAYIKDRSGGGVFTPREVSVEQMDLPPLTAAAAASAAGSGAQHKPADGSQPPTTVAELSEVIGFYTQMHHTLITLATEMCTDFMTGAAPGTANDLAPALFAYINLMVLKEKAGIERAIISGQIALHQRTSQVEAEAATGGKDVEEAEYLGLDSSHPISEGIPLAMMVGLREVVAQQEGYRTAFFQFAPRWAADAYREHRREACVVESLRMRAVLLRPLRKALRVSPVAEDPGRFPPLFLRFSIGKCRNCPFFRAFY